METPRAAFDRRFHRAPALLLAFTLALPLAAQITDGGDTPLRPRVELHVAPGVEAGVTSVSAQSLAGLLPLGWSPIASAEVESSASLAGAQLSFEVPQTTVPFTAVRYEAERDEWIVLVPVVTGGTFPIAERGAYALVYPDNGPHLVSPPPPATGAALAGVPVESLADALVAKSFTLDPPVITPTGRTVATLIIDGSTNPFPSGTAIEAFIEEELRRVDGTRVSDTPFVTDLILYRDLTGIDGVAAFHLAPSIRATEGILEVGFEHIRIQPYSRPLVRGTLIGAEGGRVPSDGSVSIDIEPGSTWDVLRTSVEAIDTFPQIAGYDVLGGFTLTLQGSEGAVELTRPATARFPVSTTPTGQTILVEVLDDTPFGTIYRLAALMSPLALGPQPSALLTVPIDRAILPVDGIIREGRYLVLAAQQPIAYATGTTLPGAKVSTTSLGTADIARATRIFALPVRTEPFTLAPRTLATGDGAPYTHASAPQQGATVNVGELAIVAQPPQVVSTLPAAGATDVGLGTTVQITFDKTIDPATTTLILNPQSSILNPVTGTVTASGPVVTWTPSPGTFLEPNTRYVVTVSPSTRATNGAPLGVPYSFSFTTIAKLTSTEVDPSKIRITIPDSNGHVRVLGAPGALPSGWLARPVRRGIDFTSSPQAQAASDGSFTIAINERVTLTDSVDLRVLNQNGALAAIIPLTPFVSEDGRAFVARPNESTTITTPDGVTVTVPAGAFDEPTVVEVGSTAAGRFDGVPRLSDELAIAASVTIAFEGRARYPLELTLPVEPGIDLTQPHFLARFGESVRGPRLMAVDTLFASSDGLSTRRPSSGAMAIRTLDTSSSDPKDFLQRVIEAGDYAAVNMKEVAGSLAWAFVDGLSAVVDLFLDKMQSLYVDHRYIAESKGRIAFPVPAGTTFRVTGVDPATTLIRFEETYNPLPYGGGDVGSVIPNPDTDLNGPYPVFGTPFRVETADAPPPGVALPTIRGVSISLDTNGNLNVVSTTTATLTARVSVLNVATGIRRGPQMLPILLPDTKPGDRMVIVVEEKNVDPAATLSIVFNEAIVIDAEPQAPNTQLTAGEVSEFLKTLIRLEQAPGIDLLAPAQLRLDSGGRRVTFLLPSPLAAGADFVLTLSQEIQDRSGNGLGLGQRGEKNTAGGITPIGPAPDDIRIHFSTRAPAGQIAEFDIRQSDAAQFGQIREIARYDNLLFVTALDGGILAYDISDPAALGGALAKPIALAPGRDELSSEPVTEYWSLQVDHHGRVFSTGMTRLFGALRSFRVEDFINARNNVTGCLPSIAYTVCQQTGGAIISQNPGSSGTSLGGSLVMSDRVEAIPRKLKTVIGDAPAETIKRDDLIALFASSTPVDIGNGLKKFDLRIPYSGPAYRYRIQRITVENETLGLRWSADAKAVNDSSTLADAQFKNVIAGPGDVLRITHNLSTYAIVTLFGYGIGVYDLNAIESNELPQRAGTTSKDRPREQIALRRNTFDDPSVASPASIGDLSFSPESEIIPGVGNSLRVYALDSRKGVAELSVALPDQIHRAGEVLFPGGSNPRFEALRSAVLAANPVAIARFNAAAAYAHGDTHYLLIPAFDFGLFAVAAGPTPLTSGSFADVFWFPLGAYAVRVIDGTNLGVVVDGGGYAHLVDLARIDERVIAGTPTTGIFPTAGSAIATGTPDPRILWTSPDPVAIGQIPPLVDSETGIMYGADLLSRRIRALSARDPKLRVLAKVREGELREIGGIVPLGIEPPPGIIAGADASLAAFRIEAVLPGSMTESAGPLRIAVESETLPGADAPQSPEPYPLSHLRLMRRDATVDSRPTNLVLERVLDAAAVPELRFQRGWNRFVSPWIIGLADPRASRSYVWGGATPQQKAEAGCASCDRPAHLLNDPAAHEIYTTGRFISIRLEASGLGAYAYLAEGNRFEARIGTTPADTVRPTSVLVAAQHPPVAEGLLQETTYVHSGEVESSSVDMDAGGRAGWSVIADRTYRSRTMGLSPLGIGWDSSLFRRLRLLPNGDVEYRNGSEVWRFRPEGGAYKFPTGLFLRLSRIDGGWTLVDQQARLTRFDELGRITSESDEFYDPRKPGSGNTILYFYDQQGRLSHVADPLGRATALSYHPQSGLLASVSDWHSPSRRIDYTIVGGRLQRVDLPAVTNTSGQRPRYELAYQSAGGSFNDQLELASNLISIKDPKEALSSGPPRVSFTYGTAGSDRDRVLSQTWATSETATFSYPGPNETTVIDVLGQERRFTFSANPLTDPLADRGHITETREIAVPVWAVAGPGQLPTNISPGEPALTTTDRTRRFTFADGALQSSEVVSLRQSTVSYAAAPGVPGFLVKSSTITPEVAGGGGASTFLPAQAPISRTFHYQQTPGGAAFLQAMEAGGKTIESPQPHRGNQEPVAENDAIESKQTFDSHGRVAAIASTGGTDSGSAGSKGRIEYWPDSAAPHMRGMPRFIREGEPPNELVTTIDYPSETRTIRTDPRGVMTITDVDAWNRPIEIATFKLGDPLTMRERYAYDATGRLASVMRKQGSDEVTTLFEYDAMGRRTKTIVDRIATVGSMTTSIAYDLANRRIITTHPGGATTTRDLDRLGRTRRDLTNTGSSPIDRRFAYDIAGNRVFETDMLTASAAAFDVHGRLIGTRASDGTITTAQFDEWSNPTNVRTLSDDTSQTLSESSYEFTAAGRLRELKRKIDGDLTQVSNFAWDGGGRTTSAATSDRVSKTSFDLAGRMRFHAAGAGSLAALSDVFSRTDVTSYDGEVPAATLEAEKGDTYQATMARNSAGDVVRSNVGPLEWKQDFDELGNMTKASVPGRPPTSWDVDSRGAVTKETLADGAQNQFSYDASGAQSNYDDPTNEATSTQRDLLGRPLVRTYADGTNEVIEWEGTRVKAVTDRQGRKQSFVYNSKGQLTRVTSGAGQTVEELSYDNGGRLVRWTNADSELSWDQFDLAGNPKRTTQTRFRNASGLSGSPDVLDSFTQQHRWNEHGERTRYSMPSYAGQTFGAGWTAWIAEEYDAMGNVAAIGKLESETASAIKALMAAGYRTAGRPDTRTVHTNTNAPIVRSYGYDSASSLMNRMSVSAAGVLVAGSEIAHDGLQIGSARLLGLSSNSRSTHFAYDVRSRLAATLTAVRSASADPLAPVPGSAREEMTPADFRLAQQRTPQLDAGTRAVLASHGVDAAAVDPPSAEFEEKPGGGHKIGQLARGAVVRPFGWQGAERVDDGRFIYEFDVKGRLIRATEKASVPPIRRLVYSYSGAGRVVGRRAEYTTVASPSAADWKLEDRPQILAADGLPADTTFAWDLLSDRLLGVYRAGATPSTDAHGGLLKQVIHGGLAYDDPIETTTVDPNSGAVTHLYPVYDEAGAGALQIVINTRGEVVARNLSNDPYGGEDVVFTGAAIDGATVKAIKTQNGALSSVEVTLRATEQLAVATVASGARLAAVDATGALVRTSPVAASRAEDDPYTIRWTLSAAEWNALTDPTPVQISGTTRTPAALSIAATNALRAEAWSAEVPVMPAPEWATATKSVYTSAALRVEIRESFTSLTTFLDSIAANEEKTATLYEVENLPLLGTPGSDTLIEQTLSATFQALPFAEPATGLVYARARWYDPGTGSFLTPDPMGYRDSSNLYAFAGGDPVNRRDPTGELSEDECREAMRPGAPPTVKGAIKGTLCLARGIGLLPNPELNAKLQEEVGVLAPDGALRPHLPEPLQVVLEKADAVSEWLDSSGVGAAMDTVLMAMAIPRVPRIGKGPGKFVPKKESMSPQARAYQDAHAGGKEGHAYRVPYENPNPRGRRHVDFDGLRGDFPVDTKIAVVTRPKSVDQARRQAESLRQTGSKAVWPVPNISEAVRARSVLRQAEADDVIRILIEK
jgi:RHS repeat-associated protein